jgi:2-phospho-L-lactate guanylyltransferase
VKSFAIAKGRLASVMSEDARAQLAKECATRVLLAAGTWPTYVVCDDDDVTQWATQHGIDHVVIAHGDLPLAHRFDHVVVDNTITLVPDRHHDGTNVLALPATSPFETTYGPQSFHRHVEQAHTLGLAHVIIEDEELSLDIDTADDVAELQTRGQSASNAKTQGSNT